jgi:hypothetical protein
LQTKSDTGEPLAEPNTQRIVWVVDRLQLTPQQQHAIAQGAAVARKLLTPLLEELKELQLQQGGEDACHHASCVNGLGLVAAAAAAGADAAAADGGGGADHLYKQRVRNALGDQLACNGRTSSSSHVAGNAAGAVDGVIERDDDSNAMQQQQQQQQQDAAGLGQLYARSVAYRQSLLLQQQRSDRMKLLMSKVSLVIQHWVVTCCMCSSIMNDLACWVVPRRCCSSALTG